MTSPSASNGLTDAIWKLFASIQLTIVLLLSLAATSVIGTLIPQNAEPAAYISAYGETVFRFFWVLGLFDMYHSWWFQLLMLMLAANVIVCSADRISAQRKILLVRRPHFRAERFRGLPAHRTFDDGRPPAELQSLFTPVFAKGLRSVQVEPTDAGFILFGETGRWTRFGVYAVHGSVVLLLIGGLIGSLFGFDGFVNIREGDTVQQIILRGAGGRLRLPFAIRCNDFDVSFYETGAPKEFRSSLTILEEGREVLQKEIIVNDPLRYRGISIFQSSYGSVPSDEAVLSFTSQATGMIYNREARIGAEIVLPENLGTFVLRELRHDALFQGHSVGDAFVGVLTPPEGDPVEIILPVRFPTFDRMRRGAVVIAVDAFKERFYTGLQVNRDPGVWVVYTGFILMLIGCYVTFFMSHQQLCVEVAGRSAKTRVRVSGTANKNQPALARRIDQLTQALKESTSP